MLDAKQDEYECDRSRAHFESTSYVSGDAQQPQDLHQSQLMQQSQMLQATNFGYRVRAFD